MSNDPSKPDPSAGPFLGNLTDELKSGHFIEEFLSLGARTYGFRTNDNQCSDKLEGFTINSQTRQHINCDSRFDMLSTGDYVSLHYLG